ncbi:MAG: GNAT family N-acetyltransferase [Pseudomonadota bacterium]
MDVTVVSEHDDLAALVDAINDADWDHANDISDYSVNVLRQYLQLERTLFVVCYEHSDSESHLLGIASGRLQPKPYSNEPWLYVDEVDVCVGHRRRGVGTRIMQEFLAIARSQGCDELWVATEADNVSANAMYRSLSPDEVLSVVGYTFATAP